MELRAERIVLRSTFKNRFIGVLILRANRGGAFLRAISPLCLRLAFYRAGKSAKRRLSPQRRGRVRRSPPRISYGSTENCPSHRAQTNPPATHSHPACAPAVREPQPKTRCRSNRFSPAARKRAPFGASRIFREQHANESPAP